MQKIFAFELILLFQFEQSAYIEFRIEIRDLYQTFDTVYRNMYDTNFI